MATLQSPVAFVCRVRVALVALTAPHLLAALPGLLGPGWSAPLTLLAPWLFAVLPSLLSVGRTIISGAGLLPISSPRFDTAAWSAAAYMLGLVVVAVPVAVTWHAFARGRTVSGAVHVVSRTYARYALAVMLMLYGMYKVIPTQFGFITPGELMKPFGQLLPMQVLWNFMAFSPAYTVATGLLEVGCGLCLAFRRTTLIGSLIATGVLLNILALDVAYDVRGAVLVVLILCILNGIILSPYIRPLGRILISRTPDIVPEEPTLATRRQNAWLVVKCALILALLVNRISVGLALRGQYEPSGRTVYGQFDVTSFSRSGRVVLPDATDAKTWQRVANDGRYGPTRLAVHYFNGRVQYYDLVEDGQRHTLILRENNGNEAGRFDYVTSPGGVVTLSGSLHKEAVQMQLQPIGPERYPLLNAR